MAADQAAAEPAGPVVAGVAEVVWAMSTHRHSALALAGEVEVGRLGQRAANVLEWVRGQGRAVRDREVCAGLGFMDMNSVRPRITELIECGLLREAGEERCPATGKLVRLVATPAVAATPAPAVAAQEVRQRAARTRRARPRQLEMSWS